MRRLILISVLLASLLGGGIAHGELTQEGGVRLDFRGSFSPKPLPRERPAPISVDVSGSILSADGGRPPELRQISIAINRYGQIYTQGLPRCQAGMLQTTDSAGALAKCRGALVGNGSYSANVKFGASETFPVVGKILAFNGGTTRRPELLLHIYGSNPINSSVVLKFRIAKIQKGTFGTVFTARIPRIAADAGYVTKIELRLNRRFRHAGEPRSFLSARCAAPAGFGGGPFPFLRGTFDFSNGTTMTSTLTRSCRVR